MKYALRFLISLTIMLLAPTVYATDYTYDDMDTLKELISEKDLDMEEAHKIAEIARQAGYSETSNIIEYATDKYYNAYNEKTEYEYHYNILNERWKQKESEYPVAAYIWSYLKKLQYNNSVCAGILGNAMAESGGHTLDIKHDLETWDYYGTFMWSKKYHSINKGASLQEQMDYLRDTLKSQFEIFGCYDGYTYEKFLELDDAQHSALVFAKVYERCSSGSYRARQRNAVIAYEYFMS